MHNLLSGGLGCNVRLDMPPESGSQKGFGKIALRLLFPGGVRGEDGCGVTRCPRNRGKITADSEGARSACCGGEGGI